MLPNHSLYLHIPFCVHRCAYCDFNTYAGQQNLIPAYVQALCNEINIIREDAPEKITLHTVFFGGGTPSLLNPDQFEQILSVIHASFDLVSNPEITIEANPGTCRPPALTELRQLGINRLSLGVQSANTEELHMLERNHDFFDVIDAFSWARQAGFENINLDLIYGLPGQSLSTWQNTLKSALKLNPDHISAYALTLEHGTPFGHWSKRGMIPLPDPDLAADMYEWASETLAGAGFRQYEISNWSKAGLECKHNLQYWRGLPYIAAGAGAHGYANGYRYSNVLRIKSYIERMEEPHKTSLEFPLTPATVNHHHQSRQDDMSEMMMTGLRLTCEGVSPQTFREKFGRELKDTYMVEIDELVNLGLLEWACDEQKYTGASNSESDESAAPEILRLTTRGRLLGNQVFVRFV